MIHIEIFGYLAAFLTTISFLPQVIKIYKEKRADDISLAMYSLFITGIIMWLIYGIMLNSYPIIIANSITLILSGTILILKMKYD